jgi:UDP-N-acetyl-D-mannosaminuronate dehydrogenase
MSEDTADGVARDSVGLGELLPMSDRVVVVTAHRAVDWDAVYREAALVVDTTNSSRGRELGPRSVLRLGAGSNAG